jgi:hypothetical protein
VVVQWTFVAIKSGKLSLGPFKVEAKDASSGEIFKSFPAISIIVAKTKNFAIPPTPTAEPNGALGPQGGDDQLRDIKGDLGFPWPRASAIAGIVLALLALAAWLLLRPPKPQKIEAVRDPGQQALMDLEKAREILVRGDESEYYKELARIIRFYLRHRMRLPEKELTLFESRGNLERALQNSGTEKLEQASGTLERLEEILFASSQPQAKDAEQLPQGLRQAILELEKQSQWKEHEIVKVELDRLRQEFAQGHASDEAYFKGMAGAFRAHFGRLSERFGADALKSRLEKSLEELGPASTQRVGYVLLSKRIREELDLDKLNKDLSRLAGMLEEGVKHGS